MKLPLQKPGPASDSEHSLVSSGVVITFLFILLGLILCGLVYWFITNSPSTTPPPVTPERPTAEMNKEPESTTAYAQVESFGVMSTSDELELIAADLESTNLDSLETELVQIDQELEATLE